MSANKVRSHLPLKKYMFKIRKDEIIIQNNTVYFIHSALKELKDTLYKEITETVDAVSV